MQEINNQINSTRDSLNQEISKIVSQQAPSSNSVQQGLLANKFKNEAAIAVAQSKKTALDQMDAQNDAIISSLPEKEQGFVRVKRDADVSNEIYVMLAKRLEEAKVAEVMVPNEVQVIDADYTAGKQISRERSDSWHYDLIRAHRRYGDRHRSVSHVSQDTDGRRRRKRIGSACLGHDSRYQYLTGRNGKQRWFVVEN